MRNRTGEARIQSAPTVADASDTTRPARERQLMTTTRRTVLVLAVTVLVSLCALPQAGAAGATAQPELGPLSPAFVEALHDPMVTLGLGRVPSPVEVKIGAAAEARAARMALPTSYDLRTEGRLTAGPGPGRTTPPAGRSPTSPRSSRSSCRPTRRRTTARTTSSGAAATSRRSTSGTTRAATTSWPSPTSPAGRGRVDETSDPYTTRESRTRRRARCRSTSRVSP